MLSKNQIRAIFQEISVKHWMLNDFGYGRKWTRTEPTAPNSKIYYPILWVVPLEATINKGVQYANYQVAVFDLVKEGEGNEMEVESDTHKILTDVVALLNNQKLYPSLVLDRNSIRINEVEHEKYQDKLTGHACILRIKTWYDANSCAVPGDGFGEENPVIPFNGDFYETYLQGKSFVIPNPIAGDDIPIYPFVKQGKVSQIYDLLMGTGSVTYNIYFSDSKTDPTPSKLWVTDRVASSEVGVFVSDFDTKIIPQDNVIWIEVSNVTGTVDLFHLTIFFNNKI